MILTPHFTWAEVERSATATARGFDNHVPDDPVLRLHVARMAEFLECVRALLRVPLTITSWYRCPDLNTAVGSTDRSRHLVGLAADVVPVGLALVIAGQQLADSALPYDQLIMERARDGAAWLHIGLSDEVPRREVLLATGDRGAMSYTRVLAT
ncbi:MAG: hypothetical protein A2W29_13440 [Gemmatimonadetes bacterium RBG_16_66_8]|nr:MAG: hypothetical protein A2W29_13440 [Gemmatimonadetes bacterium RBG_16_66_8]